MIPRVTAANKSISMSRNCLNVKMLKAKNYFLGCGHYGKLAPFCAADISFFAPGSVTSTHRFDIRQAPPTNSPTTAGWENRGAYGGFSSSLWR